jgi:hypothetical protein
MSNILLTILPNAFVIAYLIVRFAAWWAVGTTDDPPNQILTCKLYQTDQ